MPPFQTPRQSLDLTGPPATEKTKPSAHRAAQLHPPHRYGFESSDDSGFVVRPKASGFSPMIAAAKNRGT